MKNKQQIADSISDLLPTDSSRYLGSDGIEARQKIIDKKAESIHTKKTAQELARVKYQLKVEQEAQAARCAVEQLRTEKAEAKEQAIKELEEEDVSMSAEKAIEIGNAVAMRHGQPTIDMASNTAKEIMMLQGTTKPEIVRLLTGLNINLNLQLTKSDTANLLACLLTANENQLKAIYSNKKVPLAIKVIIKRLIDDSKIGNIDTVEKLWDRIFGKAGMMLNLPEQAQTTTGIIPNTPVSREAYIVIRDTLIK